MRDISRNEGVKDKVRSQAVLISQRHTSFVSSELKTNSSQPKVYENILYQTF